MTRTQKLKRQFKNLGIRAEDLNQLTWDGIFTDGEQLFVEFGGECSRGKQPKRYPVPPFIFEALMQLPRSSRRVFGS
jgi:hypothetical protein